VRLHAGHRHGKRPPNPLFSASSLKLKRKKGKLFCSYYIVPVPSQGSQENRRHGYHILWLRRERWPIPFVLNFNYAACVCTTTSLSTNLTGAAKLSPTGQCFCKCATKASIFSLLEGLTI